MEEFTTILTCESQKKCNNAIGMESQLPVNKNQ